MAVKSKTSLKEVFAGLSSILFQSDVLDLEDTLSIRPLFDLPVHVDDLSVTQDEPDLNHYKVHGLNADWTCTATAGDVSVSMVIPTLHNDFLSFIYGTPTDVDGGALTKEDARVDGSFDGKAYALSSKKVNGSFILVNEAKDKLFVIANASVWASLVYENGSTDPIAIRLSGTIELRDGADIALLTRAASVPTVYLNFRSSVVPYDEWNKNPYLYTDELMEVMVLTSAGFIVLPAGAVTGSISHAEAETRSFVCGSRALWLEVSDNYSRLSRVLNHYWDGNSSKWWLSPILTDEEEAGGGYTINLSDGADERVSPNTPYPYISVRFYQEMLVMTNQGLLTSGEWLSAPGRYGVFQGVFFGDEHGGGNGFDPTAATFDDTTLWTDYAYRWKVGSVAQWSNVARYRNELSSVLTAADVEALWLAGTLWTTDEDGEDASKAKCIDLTDGTVTSESKTMQHGSFDNDVWYVVDSL